MKLRARLADLNLSQGSDVRRDKEARVFEWVHDLPDILEGPSDEISSSRSSADRPSSEGVPPQDRKKSSPAIDILEFQSGVRGKGTASVSDTYHTAREVPNTDDHSTAHELCDWHTVHSSVAVKMHSQTSRPMGQGEPQGDGGPAEGCALSPMSLDSPSTPPDQQRNRKKQKWVVCL